MKKEIVKFLILLMVAAGAGPAGAAIWSWSTTASTNATADPSINWAEGMAPSAVNDSARAMMAVLAAWRNDVSATNTTAGTSTAYTLATSEGVNTTPANGQMLSFIAHATNGASPTLQVDGGNTYPLWLNGSVVGSGTLLVGSPYRVAFSVANSAWLLEAGYGNTGTPLGAILWSTSPTAPSSNFVAPSGQCISTTTYAAYWVQQGSPASGACPGGQFAIIDMRGRVAAGLDTLNASAANRLTSSATGCGTAMTSVGAVCANGTQGSVIPLAQLPTGIVSSVSVVSPSSNYLTSPVTGYGITSFSANSGGTVWQAFSQGASIIVSATITSTGTATSANTSGLVRPNVQDTIGLIPYLRIL
jgi:hypothetical protein